jgi:hypothetical protein
MRLASLQKPAIVELLVLTQISSLTSHSFSGTGALNMQTSSNETMSASSVRISLLLVSICYERGMYLQIVDAPVIYARP